MDALITAIIPTYKRPRLLPRAVHSVLRQTYRQLQVLVLDNASGDDTAECVAEMKRSDDRIHYYCQPENIGAMRNFQSGLRQVTTPFFSVMSDDDLLLPQFYQTAMAAFDKYPEASFVSCGVLHFGLDGRFYGTPITPWPEGIYHPPDGLLAMLRYGFTGWTGMLFRRSVLESVGYLDLDIAYIGDVDFVLRACARVPFAISHQPSAIYSTGSLTRDKTGTYPFDLVWPAWPRMIDKLTNDATLPTAVKREIRERLENQFRNTLFSLVLRYLYQNRVTEAWKAQDVLGSVFKCRLQAAVLRAAILFHKALGPERASRFWTICLHIRRSARKLICQDPKHANDALKYSEFAKYLELGTYSDRGVIDHTPA